MRTRFYPQPKYTQTRFFPKLDALKNALAREKGWVLLDRGLNLSGNLPALGTLPLAGGEGVKSWQELEKILTWLAENRAERGHSLIVIGGGAVLDLGAFAASLYRRGMRLILVPSTLLGMVDATLGGKTAVDFEAGDALWKNFAGTFYPANEVWLLPEFLATLPQRERRSGAGEVFKTLWLAGKKSDPKALWKYLEGGSPSGLAPLLRDCLSIKARFVEKDPLDDKRIREALNFGHTAGHALEAVSDLSHGESVLWGMAIETTLLGSRGKAMREICFSALRRLEMACPPECERLSEEEWSKILEADKKNRAGKIEVTLLERPGVLRKKKISSQEIARAIRAFPAIFQLA